MQSCLSLYEYYCRWYLNQCRALIRADVRTNLFDFVDFGSATVLEEQINIAIRNDEPRANNITGEVLPKVDINSFEINVYFSIVGLELPQQKFTYILESSR